MIDYLERLLAEQEAEEAAEELAWFGLETEALAGRGAPASAAARETAGSTGGSAAGVAGVESSAGGAWNGAEGPAQERGQTVSAAGTAAAAVSGISQTEGWVHGGLTVADGAPPGGTQRSTGAAWLYQQVRQSAAQAGYARPAQVFYPQETAAEPSGGPSFGPEELDRLFQRDARRYDGPFTLY